MLKIRRHISKGSAGFHFISSLPSSLFLLKNTQIQGKKRKHLKETLGLWGLLPPSSVSLGLMLRAHTCSK
jgi:hypothetical protein